MGSLHLATQEGETAQSKVVKTLLLWMVWNAEYLSYIPVHMPTHFQLAAIFRPHSEIQPLNLHPQSDVYTQVS